MLTQIQADGTGLSRRTSYGYDNGNRRIFANASDGTRTSWAYDNASQLTREWRTGGQTLATTYVYDPAGNRVARNDSGTWTTYSFVAANELLVAKTGTTGTTRPARINR